jgi:hypothetical protein
LRNAHVSQVAFMNEERSVNGALKPLSPDRSEQSERSGEPALSAVEGDLLLRNAHVSQTSFSNEERFIGARIETDLQVLEQQPLDSRSLHCTSLRSG